MHIVCAEVAQSRSDANNSREKERESLLKQEGGTVVKKNLYPPPASLCAPTQSCKTLLVMQHIKIQRWLSRGSCKATWLSQRSSEKTESGARRKEKMYQSGVDPVVSGIIFLKGCRGQRLTPLITEALQI